MSEPMILGFDESGTGAALVLVHGFPLDRTMWSEQLSDLSDIRRVIAVDLRGRGKSMVAPNEGWTIDLYADDIAATIDALGIDKVDLAGLSMGGYVVLSFWQRHPQKVRSLILIDTKAEADSPEAKEGREKTAALVREKGTTELLEGLFPKLFAPATDEDIKAKVRPMFQNTPGSTAAADALAMRDRRDHTANLDGISVPAMVIHGEQDALMPVDGARKMAEAISDAVFAAIPNAGHVAPIENPQAVNRALRDFLTNQPV